MKKINETSFELRKTLKGHTDLVTLLAVLTNNMFASASFDETIRVWDQKFQCLHVLNGHTNNVNRLVVVRKEYLISISNDQSIIFWDISKNFSRLFTTKTTAALYSLALLYNDSFITGDFKGSIKLFEMNSLEIRLIEELKQNSNETSSLIFYQKYLITGLFNGFIKIWKMDSFHKIYFNEKILFLVDFI